MIPKEDRSYLIAKNRVEKLRKYYVHLIVYLVGNLLISGVKVSFALSEGASLYDAIFNLNTFAVWIIWGIFVVIHTFNVLGLPLLLGYDWESKKLERFMEEELKKENDILN